MAWFTFWSHWKTCIVSLLAGSYMGTKPEIWLLNPLKAKDNLFRQEIYMQDILSDTVKPFSLECQDNKSQITQSYWIDNKLKEIYLLVICKILCNISILKKTLHKCLYRQSNYSLLQSFKARRLLFSNGIVKFTVNYQSDTVANYAFVRQQNKFIRNLFLLVVTILCTCEARWLVCILH